MTVLTIVTEAFRATALPFSVVMVTLPAVENEVAADEMMVPTMVPPPAGLIVAELPTCQKTFFGWAPPARMTLRGNAASDRHGERTRHLEDPDRIGVALGVEREISLP